MTMPTIVAWSWGHEKYHKAARRLRGQCGDFGYQHAIRVGADLTDHMSRQIGDDWLQRRWVYRYTPKFIREMVDLIETDILYLHCDLRIQAPVPAGAWDGLDVGLESAWSLDPPKPGSVLAAPIFVRNNSRSRRFLDFWLAHCETIDDGRGEHCHLHHAWRMMRDRDRSLTIGTFHLPIATIRSVGDTPILGHK